MKLCNLFLLFGLILGSLFSCNSSKKTKENSATFENRMHDKLYPSGEYFMMKNYPEETFANTAHRSALNNIKKQNINAPRSGKWQQEGPGNIGGRINTIAINPQNQNEQMLGYSVGGVFITTDNGDNWRPIFDDQDVLSISDITYDPIDPATIYVGTGDHNISGYPHNGYGIYRSMNGGDDWMNLGLTEAGVISEVGISKSNSDIIYAATMGIPFIKSEDRGLYRSEDKGLTWEHVFYLNDSTGVIDIEVHPDDPNIVYAATWSRVRSNRISIIASEETGIYKTIDGGTTWEKLSNGLPTGALVRPGLTMYESNPDVLYSIFNTGEEIPDCVVGFQMEGIYKTVDAGNTWVKIPNAEESGLPCDVMRGFGWYFGQIRVNPDDEDDIYVLAVDLYNSKDGGVTWSQPAPPWFTYEVHADKHDLVFEGEDIFLATDGGAYRMTGEEWIDIEDNITTQFYRVATNNFDFNSYGGAQDNGTTGGTQQVVNDWPRIFGGDGFQMVFHPTNPDVWYVETQNGNIRMTQNGGENYEFASAGLDGARNWDMQYIMSSVDPNVLYTGTNKMYRSESLFIPEWVPISGDLTDTVDLSSARSHNITTLDESPMNNDYLYCGTSDGLVWRTLNQGEKWELINEDLPRRYISDVKASKMNENVVFVTIQGYRDNDNTPYIYKSEDNGDNWSPINGNLPQIAINDILLLEDDLDAKIFAATDAGVYYTYDGGISWTRLGSDMPIIPVFDLALSRDDKLVAGTFARGIYTYELNQLDNVSTENIVDNRFKLYPSITADIVNIEGLPSGEEVQMINEGGQVVMTSMIRSNVETLDVSALLSGTYFIRPEYGQAKLLVKI